MQVKKHQLEPDMVQRTGSKLGKEYIAAISALSAAWRILNITLPAREMSAIEQQFEHFLALPFLGFGIKSPFPVLWPLLNFPNLLTY